MNKVDEHSFYRRLDAIRSATEKAVLPAIERAFVGMDPTKATSYAGQGRRLINEAQVRRYIIDPILEALGWNLGDPATMLVEAGVEPQDRSSHRRFLDYLGCGHVEECEASILVEAKRLSQELPTHDAGMDRRQVMAEALRIALETKKAANQGEQFGKLSVGWQEILATLVDYVERLSSGAHGIPRKVLLTNGEWLVVFTDPRKTLVLKDVSANDFLVVPNLKEAGDAAQTLFAQLSFESLASELPEQNAVELCRFVTPDGDPLPTSYAVGISTAELDKRPLMGVRSVIAVNIPGAGWLKFANPAVEHQILRKETELESDMNAVHEHAEALIAQLRVQRQLDLVDAVAFENAVPQIPKFPSTRLLRRIADNQFVMYLGKNTHPFVDPGAFAGCRYHWHGHAVKDGVAASPAAIVRASSEPPAYFPSGSVRHCAHLQVHALRSKKCAIQGMDSFLCCRACALQTRCWPDGAPSFPCKQQEQDVNVHFSEPS